MKLAIIVIIYAAITALALFIMKTVTGVSVNTKGKHPKAAGLILAALLLMCAFPLIGALVPDGPLCWFFQKWGNIFIGYLIYFYGTLLIVWIIWLIAGLMRKEKNKKGRSGWVLLILPLVLTIVINVSGFMTSHDVKVTNYEIPKEELNLKEPLRVVLVGDLHIGVNSTTGLYEDMVERINEQDADLVLIAGDLVTSSFGAMRDPDKYAEIFRGMESKLGIYAVYGNHDVDEPLLGGFTYAGKENAVRNPRMDGWVEDCGWILLRDEVIRIPELNNMVLIGRRDETRPGDVVEERAELASLTEGLTEEEGVLLLEHEPADLEEMGELGVDLSVSGHTHDGQIFPGNIFCRITAPQSYGLKEWGDARAVVTSGAGYYGPPIRVGTISEIVVIDLK